MELDADLAVMSAEQLREARAQAESTLGDVLEERDFTLGQTGVHIGAGELARLQKSWERDEATLTQRIAAIDALLAEAGPAQ